MCKQCGNETLELNGDNLCFDCAEERAFNDFWDSPERPVSDACPNCGGQMIGDGFNSVRICENAPEYPDMEPDCGPIYCTER